MVWGFSEGMLGKLSHWWYLLCGEQAVRLTGESGLAALSRELVPRDLSGHHKGGVPVSVPPPPPCPERPRLLPKCGSFRLQTCVNDLV